MINKINLYVFIHLFKSCTLIFFIFVSIGWLLQISRLFSYLNNFQIKLFDIFYLSIFLIPNIVNVIMPFIIIFGIITAFIKMDKDKEITAIYSLGLGINIFKKTLSFLLIIFIIFYFLLNFFYSPMIYEKYKLNEFELRNSIDLRNINFSNFIELDKKFILDFDKEDNNYKNIYINYATDNETDNENIIFAEKGEIINMQDKYYFSLVNGFKLSIFENRIEKLEFNEYNLNFPKNQDVIYNNEDKNTETLFDLLINKKFKIISERIFDIIILFSVVILFYFKNIKKNNFQILNIIKFLLISLSVLVIQNFLKNVDMNTLYFLLFNSLNISIIYLLIFIDLNKFKEI